MLSIGSNSLSIKATILSCSSIEGSGTIKLCNSFDDMYLTASCSGIYQMMTLKRCIVFGRGLFKRFVEESS